MTIKIDEETLDAFAIFFNSITATHMQIIISVLVIRLALIAIKNNK
jgi:hypothetical protein